MHELTPSQKGAAAEAEIAAAAIRLRLQVLRPLGEAGAMTWGSTSGRSCCASSAKDYELRDVIERHWGMHPTLPDFDLRYGNETIR
jgi:hypothetical protein